MPGARKRVDFSRLVDWVEGRLPENEAREVEEQVAKADSGTLADVAWLRKFVKATDNTLLESPPQEVRDVLIARFEARAEGRRVPGLLQRVAARLAFDSDLRPAVGLRSVDAEHSRRQLIYSTDALDVALNLRLRAPDSKLDVYGQLFPRQDEELELFSVQLVREGTQLALVATDRTGSFVFQEVPPGTYEMVLSSDRIEISIVPVALSA
jgi:hypothetical protein